jgi:hypothetical protein
VMNEQRRAKLDGDPSNRESAAAGGTTIGGSR